jgi:hypothetical protein
VARIEGHDDEKVCAYGEVDDDESSISIVCRGGGSRIELVSAPLSPRSRK